MVSCSQNATNSILESHLCITIFKGIDFFSNSLSELFLRFNEVSLFSNYRKLTEDNTVLKDFFFSFVLICLCLCK